MSNGINVNHHTITNVGFDPQLGGTVLKTVDEGLHSFKVGNSIPQDFSVSRISYTFMVTQANANFGFRFAMVLEDGDHTFPQRNPYFSWTILKGTNPNKLVNTNGTSNIIETEKYVADKKNPFFKNGRGSLVYRDWSSVCTDLTKYIGQQVTISFLTSDCSKGGHYAYAYIDGLCGLNGPIVNMDLQSRYCSVNDDVILDATASLKEDSYFLSVQESDAYWSNIGPEYNDWFVAQQAGQIDLKAYLNSKGVKFECNKYYRVKLALTNDCVQWVDEVRLIYFACPVVKEIDDIILCCGEDDKFKIGPVGRDPSYQYTWTTTDGDGTFLSFSPSNNTAEYLPHGNGTIQVTVSDNSFDPPCEVIQDIDLIVIDDFTVNINESKIDCCNTKLSLDIKFKDDCNDWSKLSEQEKQYYLSKLNINWSNGEHGTEILVSGPSSQYSVIVTGACFSDTATYNYTHSVAYYPNNLYPYIIQTSNALLAGSSDPLHANMIVIGSTYDAQGLLFPDIGTYPGIYALNAIKLTLYNRWGQIFKTLEFYDCGELKQGDVRWDGTDESGNYVQDGTYVFTIEIKTCNSDEWKPYCNAQNYNYLTPGSCTKYCWGRIPGKPFWVIGRYCCERYEGESVCAYKVTVLR